MPDAIQAFTEAERTAPALTEGLAKVRARPEISAPSLGVEAPAGQGARSAHTGRM